MPNELVKVSPVSVPAVGGKAVLPELVEWAGGVVPQVHIFA